MVETSTSSLGNKVFLIIILGSPFQLDHQCFEYFNGINRIMLVLVFLLTGICRFLVKFDVMTI